MNGFGVTPDGFVPKGLADILGDMQHRVRDLFGPEVDLSPTSALAKILQVCADEDALLWRRMEDLYYSQFVSTATGADLDLLGDDLGVPRRHLPAEGTVTLTIQNPAPDRVHLVPAGIVLLSHGSAPQAFRTLSSATLGDRTPTATVPARAFEPGPAGNVAAGAVDRVDPDHLRLVLDLPPPTTLAVTNPAPFDGGQRREPDAELRARQLGFPREMWTVQRVRAAVLDVPGVLDVLLSGPLGGVDVSQSYFNLFLFGRRAFGATPPTGEPYFFTVIVAFDPTWPWESAASVAGIRERVQAAVELVRPVGVHPEIVPAQPVEIGVRATVVADPGMDAPALRAAVVGRLTADLGGLRLGGELLFSQAMRLIVDEPGVLDVRDLRLRRSPAGGRFTGVVAGGVEAGAGENLALGPTEMAVLRADSALFDIEVVGR